MIIFEPFTYQFFVRAFLAALLVGALCGLVSVYIVIRKMSYIGHGLSHAIFGGAVVFYILGANFYVGASIWGVISAIIISSLSIKKRVAADAAIGIVTTASFAIGVALLSRAPRFMKNIDAALFGNILGVNTNDILSLCLVLAFAVLVMFIFHRQLLFVSFDPEVAPVYGVNIWLIEIILAIILALTIVVSLQIMGVTLIAALLILPAATVRLWVDDFNKLLLISPLIGSLSGIIGLYVSYFLNIPSGSSIVLVSTIIFAFAYFFSSYKHNSFSLH